MIAVWYAIVSLMLVIYVILDGRNFGAGIVQRLVAKTPEERRQVVDALGPLWSWDEVWLVSFGGVLLAVFPRVLASAFAGYYLALMLILWCLILRGISLELRGHMENPLWQEFWDGVFMLASVLLALLFGAAAGNQVRGVPLDAHGDFAMAFFTNFGVGGYVGLLDWFTVSMAAFTATALAAHGATYLTLSTEGVVRERCWSWARRLWAGVVPLFAAISLESWVVRPHLAESAIRRPFCWLGALGIGAAFWCLLSGFKQRSGRLAFAGSNLFLAGILATGSAALYPVMLYSTLSPTNSLTASAAAADSRSLVLASFWWPAGFVLSLAYFVLVSKRYMATVSVSRDNHPGCT